MNPSFKVTMQGKQLENEARRLQKESLKERSKARAELKKGNRSQAAVYAQNSRRFEMQAQQLLQQAGAVTGYATDMRAAEVTAQTAGAMNTATASMQASGAKVNIAQLSANRQKMDGMKQQLGAANVLLCSTEGDPGLEAGANDLLDALEQENQFALLQLETIPDGQVFAPPATTGPGKRDQLF
jgi:hypothetical protein